MRHTQFIPADGTVFYHEEYAVRDARFRSLTGKVYDVVWSCGKYYVEPSPAPLNAEVDKLLGTYRWGLQVNAVQFLANATKTYYCCGGHWKAERNKMLMDKYKLEIQRAGKEIPIDTELLKIGVFNGEGSY